MPAPLKWVSTPALGQGRASGGSTAAELFEAGSSQKRRPLLETLVREICQNSCDQRTGSEKASVYFDLLLLKGEERDAQHLIVHMATSLQRISLRAEEDKQYAAAVGAQKMLYELLLRRKLDHEAAKASRPGWGYRHGNTRA